MSVVNGFMLSGLAGFILLIKICLAAGVNNELLVYRLLARKNF